MKSFIAVILSFYVLIGSAGLPFSKHSCRAMEKTEYGFDLSDSCCSEKSESSSEEKIAMVSCCEYLSAYLQVDYEAYSHAEFFNIEAPVIEYNSLQDSFTFIEAVDKTLNEKAPPLFYGRSLLTFVQSFLV